MEVMFRDEVRDFIAQRLATLRISEVELSSRIGKNPAYINQYLKRGIPEVLSEETRHDIAKILGVSENLLKPEKNIKNLSEKNLQPKVVGPIDDTSFGPSLVPILGHANGSNEAVILDFDDPIGEVPIHPNQKNVKGGFALYAAGESMSPRYRPGELVYALAKRSPLPAQDCVVVLLKDNESYLKEFVKMTDKHVICRQLHPEQEWKRLRSEVKAIHAVVGRG